MVETAVSPSVKHASAHKAMHADLSVLSPGFVWCGQQSRSSIATASAAPMVIMCVMSADFAAAASDPAAGSRATDNAIKSANIVRRAFITQGKIADLALARSNDEFARPRPPCLANSDWNADALTCHT